MKWGNIFWTWIRPVYTHVDVNVINDMVKIFGEEGSIWGTAELRKVWFPDQESPPVSNILCTEEPISFAHNYDQSFSIEFDFVPNKHGAQAGVLLYFNDLNYVKYVIEGNRTGGTMLLVARQIAGEPKVLKKCDITCSAGRKVRLGLVLRRSPKSVQNCPTGSLSFEVNGLEDTAINGLFFELSEFEFNEPTEQISDNGMRLGHRFAAMAHSFSDANAPFSQWATLSNPCLTRLVDSSSDNGSSPSSESVPSKKKARLNESELWTEESTLDPADWTSFGTQSHHMLDDALNYVQNIRERPVWQPIPDDTRSRFQTMLPRLSGSLEEVHGSFLRDILPYVVGNVHPGFMGWVHGGGNPVAMVADMLAAGLNANVGGRNQIPVEVERQVTRWMRELFQFPDTASGIFVTGTSMANLMSVHIARRHALGSTVRQSGLRESPRQLVAYTSTEAHGCISQAMDLSGIGSSFLRLIPCNDRYQIDTEALVATIAADRAAGFEPFMIIGTAGSVDVGAVDPLNQLADIASVEKLWFHVDGAYGALGVLSPILAPLFSGLERADSIAFDFHKWAQVQYDAGFLLVRDGTSHMETFAAPAAYLRREVRGLAGGSPWPCDFGPDLSRSFRALKTWFTFQVYGADKLGQIIQNTCDIAQYLVGKISAYKELELLAPVTLNIVCFRFIGGISVPMISNSALDSLNSEIVADLHESGTVAPSVTTIDSKLAIRVAIVNHRTNKQNIDLLIEKVLNLGSIRLEGISLVA